MKFMSISEHAHTHYAIIEAHLKTYQTSKMERFAKLLAVNYSRKTLHLRRLTEL